MNITATFEKVTTMKPVTSEEPRVTLTLDVNEAEALLGMVAVFNAQMPVGKHTCYDVFKHLYDFIVTNGGHASNAGHRFKHFLLGTYK